VELSYELMSEEERARRQLEAEESNFQRSLFPTFTKSLSKNLRACAA
jgi:hypothetical protein